MMSAWTDRMLSIFQAISLLVALALGLLWMIGATTEHHRAVRAEVKIIDDALSAHRAKVYANHDAILDALAEERRTLEAFEAYSRARDAAWERHIGLPGVPPDGGAGGDDETP